MMKGDVHTIFYDFIYTLLVYTPERIYIMVYGRRMLVANGMFSFG